MLEEAIESFLKQDYPQDRCELIVVNDFPLQTLKLTQDIPNIHIYNLDITFSTIGEKENYAIERCKGELIAVWDDDDIAMPNHLSTINEYFTEDKDLLHWERGVFYNYPNITNIEFIGNSGIVYRKDAWEKIGKSPLENAGGDMTLVNKLTSLKDNNIIFASPEIPTWFYRWHLPSIYGDCYHQSGLGTDNEERMNVVQRNAIHIYKLAKQNIIPTGEIILKPNWNTDFKILLDKYIEKN